MYLPNHQILLKNIMFLKNPKYKILFVLNLINALFRKTCKNAMFQINVYNSLLLIPL